jgi:hypothetical protein
MESQEIVNRRIIFPLLAILVPGHFAAGTDPSYSNPIIPGNRPDPRIIRLAAKSKNADFQYLRVKQLALPNNGYVDPWFGTPEKNRSGPHRHKFPPACPNLSLCPNDFSLEITPRPRPDRFAYALTG